MANTFRWGGRNWGAGDRQKFAAWLNKRGASLGAWADNHPDLAGQHFPGYLEGAIRGEVKDPRALSAAIAARANSSLSPELSFLQGERAKADKSAANLIGHQTGMAEALGKMLKDIGPAIDSGYQRAAGLVGSLGKGFGDAQVAQGSTDAQAAQALLDKAGMGAQGAGVAAAAGGQDAGDVLFGTGGFIPSSTLAREGAAFGAAAEMLPDQAAGLALESGRQIAGKAQEADLDLVRQIAALKAKVPGLRQEILDQILSGRRADEAMRISREQLGLEETKTNADITGYYRGPDGNLYPTAETAEVQAEAAADAAKAKDDKSKDHLKGVQAREKAFDGAQAKIHNDARFYVKEEVREGKFGVKEKVVTRTPYAEAKTALFNKYKYLLRHSTKQYRFQLRKRLNQIIDEALAARGITPPPAAPKPSPNGAAKAKPRRG